MSALTVATTVKRLNAESVLSELTLPVKASAKIYGGATVATDSTGYAVPATAATGLKCWGVAEETVDNTGGSSGALTIKVRCGGVSRDVGGSGDALTVVDIGKVVFAIDDHTVGKTDGSATRSPAGIFLGYETDGIPYFLINYQVTALASAEAADAAAEAADAAAIVTLTAAEAADAAAIAALTAALAALTARVVTLEGP